MSKIRTNDKKTASDTTVLAIESSTFCSSVAILGENGLLALDVLHARTNHSGRLLPIIQRLLSETQLDPAGLGAIAVSLGPGSFTGVRVGLSIAKGIACTSQIPLIGVPTLEGLARRFFEKGSDVCPLLDARRGEIYGALFSVDGAGRDLKRNCPDVVEPIDRFLKRIRRRTVFLGDGTLRYKREIIEGLGDKATLAPMHRFHPSAEEVAAIGLSRLKAGDIDDAPSLSPIYLRKPDAKIPRDL